MLVESTTDKRMILPFIMHRNLGFVMHQRTEIDCLSLNTIKILNVKS